MAVLPIIRHAACGMLRAWHELGGQLCLDIVDQIQIQLAIPPLEAHFLSLPPPPPGALSQRRRRMRSWRPSTCSRWACPGSRAPLHTRTCFLDPTSSVVINIPCWVLSEESYWNYLKAMSEIHCIHYQYQKPRYNNWPSPGTAKSHQRSGCSSK